MREGDCKGLCCLIESSATMLVMLIGILQTKQKTSQLSSTSRNSAALKPQIDNSRSQKSFSMTSLARASPLLVIVTLSCSMLKYLARSDGKPLKPLVIKNCSSEDFG
jgi:hypothetical protein